MEMEPQPLFKMKKLIEMDTINNFKKFNEAIKIEAEKLG